MDLINDTIAGSDFTGFKVRYHNAGGAEVTALEINAAGELLASVGLRPWKASISDDTAVSLSPVRTEGIIAMTCLGAVTQNAIVAYDVVGTPQCVLMSSGGSPNVAVTTGVLMGTTGADGKLTISAANDGKIYVENRTGAAVAVLGTYLS